MALFFSWVKENKQTKKKTDTKGYLIQLLWMTLKIMIR